MNAAKKAISKLKTRTCDGPEVKEVNIEKGKNNFALILACGNNTLLNCVQVIAVRLKY